MIDTILYIYHSFSSKQKCYFTQVGRIEVGFILMGPF